MGAEAVAKKLRPYAITPSDFFSTVQEVKGLFSTLINQPDPLQVALVPSVSYGMSAAANNLPIKKGDRIIVSSEQFPSNYYPWLKVATEKGATVVVVPAPPPGGNHRGEKWNQAIKEEILKGAKVVALPVMHWADGTRFNLKEFGKLIHNQKGYLAIDGTQSVGALPFDVQEIKPDVLVCAAYKWLMGPYATAFAYYGSAFENGKPLEENWINRAKSEQFDQLVNYRDAYQPGSTRFDMGEKSNFIALPILKEALKNLLHWQVEAIQSYCFNWSAPVIQELRQMGCWIENPDFRAGHLWGVYLPENANLPQLKEALTQHQIMVSFRGKAIRVSPHIYNDEADQSRLLSCFSKFM